jgi:hypothetical protein
MRSSKPGIPAGVFIPTANLKRADEFCEIARSYGWGSGSSSGLAAPHPGNGVAQLSVREIRGYALRQGAGVLRSGSGTDLASGKGETTEK